mmetsp:Transcript_130962/g.407263  ORF Transcript_130962/g.407263 Transcript_130962/m.407263 type:complete len:225 (+) Transcript_130962:675-1349(+)
MVLHQRVDDGDGAAQAGRRADLPALHQRAGQVGHRRGPTRGDEDGGRVGGERGNGDEDEEAQAQGEDVPGRRLRREFHAAVHVTQAGEEQAVQKPLMHPRGGARGVVLGNVPLQQTHDEARDQEDTGNEPPERPRKGLCGLQHHGPEVQIDPLVPHVEVDALAEEGAGEGHLHAAPVHGVPEGAHTEVEVPHGDVAHASRVAAAVRVEAALGQGPVGQLPPGEA